MKKLKFYLLLFIINSFFKGHRFFKIKNILLTSLGVKIGKESKVVGPIFFSFVNKIEIGDKTWVGKNFTIDGNGEVIVGDNCDLAPNIVINTGGHEIGEKGKRAGKGRVCKTIIKSGTWIGSNVLIVNGASIGDSVVVAAGSVVVNDITNDVLVAGVPAKIKKILN